LDASRYRPSRSYKDDDSDEEDRRKKDRVSARYPSSRNNRHHDRRHRDSEDDSSSEDEHEREKRLRKREKHKSRSKNEVSLAEPDASSRAFPSIPAEAPSPTPAPPAVDTSSGQVPPLNLGQAAAASTVPVPEPEVEEPDQENVVSISEVVAAANAVDPMASTSKVRGGGADYFVINDILTKQLAITVAPFILHRLKYIYMNKCRGSIDMFVKHMRDVPKWNDLVIQQRTKETLEANPSALYYFNYSYGARCLLLTNAVKRENDVEFEIPETKYAAYIFACYIATAKHFVDFPRTMLYCDPNVDYDDFKRGKQEQNVLAMIRDFCANALQSLIPFKQIVKMQGAPVPKEEEQYEEQGNKPYYSSSGEEEDEEDDSSADENPDPRQRPRDGDDDEDEDEEDDDDEDEDEEDEDEEDDEDEEEDDEDEDD
jgi:hypothetical protein